MSEAEIIDGKAFAQRVRERVTAAVATLKADHNIVPGLTVVLVGEDPVSQVYVSGVQVEPDLPRAVLGKGGLDA